MLALFKRPDDVAAFERHYEEVHAPLMRQVPGLARMTVLRDVKGFAGDPDIYLVAEMDFPDQEAFDTAMRSPENRAAGKDLMSFARSYVTLLYGELAE
jgi:uncharacterized protein (TIGR02118 family)